MRALKSVSFSDLDDFRRCPERWFRVRFLGEHAETVTVPRVVGNAVHAAAQHGFDMDKARPQIEAELGKLSAADAEIARDRVMKQLPVGAKLEEGDSDSDQREKKYKWTDPETGIVWVAKPDKCGIYQDRRKDILRIIDYKTAAPQHRVVGEDSGETGGKPKIYVAKRTRDALFFFGFVVRKVLKHEGPIELVVRLLGESETIDPNDPLVDSSRGPDREVVMKYAYPCERRMVEAVHADIAKIRKYLADGEFPRKAHFHCRDCPLKSSCGSFAEYDRISNGGRALPVVAAS